MTSASRRHPIACLLAAVVVAIQGASAAAAPSATATPDPCDSSGARLELQLSAEPSAATVGDVVALEVTITNPSGGLAGLPTYSLSGAAPVFTAELVDGSHPLPEFARYRLTAVAAGRATLSAAVRYETAHDCFGYPIYFFRSSVSDPFVIDVRAADDATPTPTPIPAEVPTPTSERPPPVAVIDAGPNPARRGERVDLDSRRSYGAINGRYWRQLDGPPVELQGCSAGTLGCLGDTAWFAAPAVPRPATLRFELLLTSYGATSWDQRQFEIAVLPSACAGDCDGDARVTVAEIVRAVAVALGSAPLSTCEAADADASGTVTIDDLVAALGAALDGCAAPTGT